MLHSFVGRINILAEYERWCVVAKPAGIMVHPNKFSARGEESLMSLVRDQLGHYVNSVHRLDNGTSGCLIFSYDSPTTAMLQQALQSPDAQKVYLAHTRGDASWIQQHTVERPIRDDTGTYRDSRTVFDCLASCSDDLPERSSLIRCRPSTGRWHQIRKQ